MSMLHLTKRFFTQALPLCAVLFLPLASGARTLTTADRPTDSAIFAGGQGGAPAKGEDEPPYHEYKGVRLGMSADEARKKLGDPADKGDRQDFYAFSDHETAQIFYDDAKKVYAISVFYMGAVNGVPTAKAVLGEDVAPSADGSLHKVVDYPKAGCWVSYSRTAGDAPMTTITMQKRQR
jgi:hypothetical protein